MSDPTPPAGGFPSPIAERLRAGAFLLIDKPRGPTSHQVTAWVRDLLRLDRAGHAGTLDPNVSGLLWVGVGPALKLLPMVLDFPKEYLGVIALHGNVPDADLDRVLGEFCGPVYQTPPVRSAVKRERRVRTIHRLERLDRDHLHVLVDVVADSGTYVRTLAVDVGEALGIGAHLAELRRVATGPFRESASVPLATVADAAQAASDGTPELLLALLHPIVEAWGEFPRVVMKDGAASAVAHGADLSGRGIVSLSRPFAQGALVALVDRRDTLIATGVALVESKEISRSAHGWVIDARRVLADPAQFPPKWKATPAPPPGQ